MASHPVPEDLAREAVEAYEKHGSKNNAARALGLAPSTYWNRLEAGRRYAKRGWTVAPLVPNPEVLLQREREAKSTRASVSRFETLYKESEREIGELKTALDLATTLDGREPRKIIQKKVDSAHEATPWLLASDWHCEERVDPAQLGGIYNKYDPDIFRKSAERFFQNGLTLIEQQKPWVKIHEVVLVLGGDMITNYLHEENKLTNFMGPSKACELAYDALASGIDFLLNNTEYEFRVICKVGNHGRTTKEMFSAVSNDNSWEYLLYRMLAKRYHGEARVEFILDDAYHTYFTCYKTVVRVHHGEGVKYQGGVGGITIPINKSIFAWNQATRADIDVMGHFHQYTDGEHFIVNGSLIGVNPWSLKMKFKPEPPRQTMFLIDSKYGKTGRFPIFVR